MPTLQLNSEQVIELVRQLPPDEKRVVIGELVKEFAGGRDERMALAESRLIQLCAQRGLNWKAMSEAEREAFIDDLVHEDR